MKDPNYYKTILSHLVMILIVFSVLIRLNFRNDLKDFSTFQTNKKIKIMAVNGLEMV